MYNNENEAEGVDTLSACFGSCVARRVRAAAARRCPLACVQGFALCTRQGPARRLVRENCAAVDVASQCAGRCCGARIVHSASRGFDMDTGPGRSETEVGRGLGPSAQETLLPGRV